MKGYFPRNEFQRLGLSEVAIRYLERLKDLDAVESNVGAVATAVSGLAKKIPGNLKESLETAQAQAGAWMPDIPPRTIQADYTGTVLTGQLPINVPCKRYYGDTDVTTQAVWSAATESGSATYTIGAATGIVNLTALGASSVIVVTSVHNGVTLTKKLTITKQNAAPPTSGGGGSGSGGSASTSSFNSINSNAMATITTADLEVTTGSAGAVALSAPLGVTTDAIATVGSFEVYLIWQRDTTGAGAWADVGTEVASNPDCTVTREGDPISGWTYYVESDGSVTATQNVSGLGASTAQKFRLRARNASGTRTMYFYGTASAVGS